MARIWKLGDNVNTDVIIPGRYNVTTDRAQLAQHCLCEILPEFAQQVQAGDVIMAGHNFGWGLSRAHAAAGRQARGVVGVIARGVCVIAGAGAAREVVLPTVDVLRLLAPDIEFREVLSGREGVERYGEVFPVETRAAIDDADCTLFGASGGPSRPVLWYLRWGK